jgi:hypothetical protein
MDLDAAADRLYGLPPGEFTAERDRLAREVRGADRRLADQIHELRRPNLAAWAVNLFARRQRNELDALLELGAQLRAAQDSLDAGELRALSRQRRDVVSAVLGEIRRLARDEGQPLSDQVVAEVGQTLDAALADAGAADDVRRGRLTGPLVHVGFGAEPGSGGTARADRRDAGAPAPSRRPAGRPDRAPAHDGAAAQERAAAEAAARLRDAEQARREAEEDLARRRDELEAARAAAEQARDEEERDRHEVESLESRLDAARDAAVAAGRARRGAEATLRHAEQRAEAAAGHLEQAAQALERARRHGGGS